MSDGTEARARVWDGFVFFNELETLRIRLHELESVVDYFVLVEATVTFRGKPKALLFDENKRDFARWTQKIIHVVVDDLPPGDAWSPWEREHHQRRAIMRGLHASLPDDLVIIADVDEIPRASVIEELLHGGGELSNHRALRHRLRPIARRLQLLPSPVGWSLAQRNYAYTLDWENPQPWSTIRVVRRGDLLDPQTLRFSSGELINEAGWHFSFLGDADTVRDKLAAWSHAEYDIPTNTGPELEHRRRLGQEPLGRFWLVPVEVGHHHPLWVQRNLKTLPASFFRDRDDG